MLRFWDISAWFPNVGSLPHFLPTDKTISNRPEYWRPCSSQVLSWLFLEASSHGLGRFHFEAVWGTFPFFMFRLRCKKYPIIFEVLSISQFTRNLIYLNLTIRKSTSFWKPSKRLTIRSLNKLKTFFLSFLFN